MKFNVASILSVRREVVKQLNKDIASEKRAMTSGMRAVTNGLKAELRGAVESSGMSKKFANTWRGTTYPKAPSVSFGPAGYVYSKAPEIMSSFNNGATIQANNTQYLAIPTKYANSKRRRSLRMTPQTWAKMGLPPLQFVKTSTGGMLIIKGSVSASGKSFRTGKDFKQGKKSHLVAFILVKRVKMPKKFNFDEIALKWYNRFPEEVNKLARLQ